MRYTYTDIQSIEINISMQLYEVETLIEYLASLEGDNKNWTISKLKKTLIKSRQDTFDLMKAHAESMEEQDD